MDNKIDFIIPWVDHNDQVWLNMKNNYSSERFEDDRNIRYRNWNNLHYWFRGVEKFSPWVNKVHLVTYGHYPKWLNINHPKLNIVNHEDFIPKEFLPTFSSRVIEMHLHKIPDLTEQFVYFNDDIFIIDKVFKDDFFKNNKPKEMAVLDITMSRDKNHSLAKHNGMSIINKYFSKKDCLINNFFKWFNFRYKLYLFKTILLIPITSSSMFPGLYVPHLHSSFLKSTFYEVWKYEGDLLRETSRNKFRNPLDVNQYIFKYWQIASGNFVPSKKLGKRFNIGIELKEILKVIQNQTYSIICINDSVNVKDFSKAKSKINKAFDSILNEKSSFEL